MYIYIYIYIHTQQTNKQTNLPGPGPIFVRLFLFPRGHRLKGPGSRGGALRWRPTATDYSGIKKDARGTTKTTKHTKQQTHTQIQNKHKNQQ